MARRRSASRTGFVEGLSASERSRIGIESNELAMVLRGEVWRPRSGECGECLKFLMA